MNISPLEIRKREFKKSLRGYDSEEVMAFLEIVSVELENCVRENAMQKEKMASLEVQIKKYYDMESTLRETLLSAQRAREETIDTAKKHAEVIIREAEVKAAAIIEEGRREINRLRSTFIELKIQKENYLTKIRSMIASQLEMLKNVEFVEEKVVEKIDMPVEAPQPSPPPPQPLQQPKKRDRDIIVESERERRKRETPVPNPLDLTSFDLEDHEQ